MLGTKSLAVKIADESIVSGSLLTVESNHFCVLKARGAVLNVYERANMRSPLLTNRCWLDCARVLWRLIPLGVRGHLHQPVQTADPQ